MINGTQDRVPFTSTAVHAVHAAGQRLHRNVLRAVPRGRRPRLGKRLLEQYVLESATK